MNHDLETLVFAIVMASLLFGVSISIGYALETGHVRGYQAVIMAILAFPAILLILERWLNRLSNTAREGDGIGRRAE